MAWPGITDFSEAIQDPRLCFKSTTYETGKVSVNQRGMPLVFSGAFACVYQLSVGGRNLAVRCFTREVKDQQKRYDQLSEYLINVLPPSFVHFEYLEQGINWRGNWYPVVMMEWVEGESLSSFIGSHVNDHDTLRRMAAQWRGGPAASLRGLGIAHNDLQHGNVMVQTDGRIRLVDYDGMFLSKFRGERSPELGHKNFQHPLRTADDYDAYVDNFPSLVIYVSLLAIASDPGLWSFYNDDNLIFTRNDYADPGSSQLFDVLKKSHDQTVAKLSERLEGYCALPVKDVPDLETVLQGIPSSVTPSSSSVAPSPTVATPPSPAMPTTHSPSAAPSPPSPPAVLSAPSLPAASSAATPGYRQILQSQRLAQVQPAPSAPSSAPTAPSSPSPAKSKTLQLGQAASLASAGLRRGAPGEIKKVLLGVTVTVAVVTLAVVAVIAWAISVRGWE